MVCVNLKLSLPLLHLLLAKRNVGFSLLQWSGNILKNILIFDRGGRKGSLEMMPVICVVAGRYSCVLIWMNGLWQFQENTRNHHGREVLKSLSNKKVKKPRHIYLSRSFHDSSKENSSLIPRWICPVNSFFLFLFFFLFCLELVLINKLQK